MSDYDRSRRRKKRLPYGSSSKDKDESDFGNSGTMVILAKPQQDQSQSAALSDPGVSNIEGKAPVLLKSQTKPDASKLSKPSDNGATSTNTTSVGGGSGGTVVYQLQQKQTSHASSITSGTDGALSLEQKLAPPPDMLAAVKLIDEALLWCDNLMEFLQDQNDFYVVGIVGLQGCGKSTVLSLLSGHYHHGRQVFKAQTSELCELGAHCTNGVDAYITHERTILLDTQPILSASVMDCIIQHEKKMITGPEYTSTENALQMQSLQIASFLMAVCHTVILVQDWFTDANLLRFIQSAEMLKPATPTATNSPHDMVGLMDDLSEHYPHLVFVQNRCSQSDFAPESIAEMDRTLRIVFSKSRLKYQGFVTPTNAATAVKATNNNNGVNSEKVNLFLLPEKTLSNGDQQQDATCPIVPEYKGHAGFKELSQNFNRQILGMPPTLLTRTTISEKNWFHYAARIWEAVKKSNLFLEYNRLLP